MQMRSITECVCRPSRHTNPFATCWTRPGAIAFHFPPGESAEQLVARLAADNWRGEIVGPHGSGKSTLLETLEAAPGRGRTAASRPSRSTTASAGCPRGFSASCAGVFASAGDRRRLRATFVAQPRAAAMALPTWHRPACSLRRTRPTGLPLL